MKRSFLSVALVIISVLVVSVKVYSSTNKPQTYVSKSGFLNPPQKRPSAYLFAQQMEDSIRAKQVDSIKLKDPKMAVFYAIIPGIAFHGSGHFYAGKPKTGLILLGTEAVGFVFFMRGVAAGFRENGADGGGSFQVITGFTLFLGSWIYDMIGAPLAVQKQNQELLGKTHMDLKFEFSSRKNYVGLQIARRF
jgi:hypothetical protein